MPLYQVLARPDPAALYAGESGAKFIEEKFSWGAMLLPPIWALFHRLWLECVLIIAFIVVLCVYADDMGEGLSFLIYALCAFSLGFAAPGIRARNLKRQGFTFLGDAVATSAEAAEADYVRARVSA